MKPNQTSDDAIREKIMLAMLVDVPFDGWNRRALVRGAESASFIGAELGSLFPRGLRDAAKVFSEWADHETEKRLAKTRRPAKLRERIALGVTTRLEVLAPHREALRRLLAYLALPLNLPLGAKLLYGTIDTLWHAAGDTSTDFSFYTKRGLLAGIYAATTLYWLDDKSDGFTKTHAFLDRRIAEVMAIPKLRARAERMAGALNPLRFRRAN